MKIYLAGPMSTEPVRGSMAEWRRVIVDHCGNVEFLCPELSGCDHTGVSAMMTVEDDLEMLEKADGVLAYLDSPERVGTCVEIGFAIASGVPVYLVISKWVHDRPTGFTRHSCSCGMQLEGFGWPWFVEAAVYRANGRVSICDESREWESDDDNAQENPFTVIPWNIYVAKLVVKISTGKWPK